MARKRGITRDDIAAAVREIADAGGLESVTLASVAQRLRIRSPSLYAHVDGLGGLHRLLALEAAGSLARTLESAAGERTGLEAIREIAFAYRRFSREHPGLYAAAQRAVRPGEDEELYRALAAAAMPAIRAFGECGIEPPEQVHLTRAFRSALHGFVSLEQAGGFGMPESVDESFRRMVDLLLSAVRGLAATRPGRPEEAPGQRDETKDPTST